MNRKNTKVQAKAINVDEVQKLIEYFRKK